VLWVDEQQELSLAEILAFSNLRQLDDGLVHEVELGHSIQLPDQASVVKVTNVARVKNFFELVEYY
jgi:hypothetical protein